MTKRADMTHDGWKFICVVIEILLAFEEVTDCEPGVR